MDPFEAKTQRWKLQIKVEFSEEMFMFCNVPFSEGAPVYMEDIPNERKFVEKLNIADATTEKLYLISYLWLWAMMCLIVRWLYGRFVPVTRKFQSIVEKAPK